MERKLLSAASNDRNASLFAQLLRKRWDLTEASKLRLMTGTQAVQEQARGALILDTRPAERFASFHIRRAVQITLAGRFASWAAFLITARKRIVLVGETVPDVQEAYVRLTRVRLGASSGM